MLVGRGDVQGMAYCRRLLLIINLQLVPVTILQVPIQCQLKRLSVMVVPLHDVLLVDQGILLHLLLDLLGLPHHELYVVLVALLSEDLSLLNCLNRRLCGMRLWLVVS